MALTKNKEGTNTLKFVLIIYVIVFLLKLVVYLISGVFVVLAEALHTLNDIIISGFLLGAAFYARKEADEKHMFGHGRVQNIAAFFAATLFISVTSFKLYDEAIHELLLPPVRHYQHIPYVITMFIISIIICAMPIIKISMQKKRDATLKAQFIELINDELSIIAALIGTLFIMWGHPLADPIATIIVATIIAINAIILFKENLSFLLGLSPGPAILAKLEEIARSVQGVIGVHELRAEYIGPDKIHADMHIQVERGQSIEDADVIAEEVCEKVNKEAGCPYCIVHIDPTGVPADPGRKTIVKTETEDRIFGIMKKHQNLFMGYHDLNIVNHQDNFLVTLHLLIDGDSHIEEAHTICDHLERDIKELIPEAQVNIHIEPYRNS